MITLIDLEQAIAECQGQRTPNANTCIKLAAYYIIKNELFPNKQEMFPNGYSFSPAEHIENSIDYNSDTDFAAAVQGKDYADVLPVLDEIMSAIQIMQPRLYANAMRRLQE